MTDGRRSGGPVDPDERRTADTWRFTDPVRRQARRAPGTTAVVDAGDGDGERLTYGDLDRAVDRTAGRLAALGLGAGDHLGALVGTRVAAARLVHAAARLGVTLVPVDPRGGADAVRDRVDRADATAVVCERPTEAVAVDALTDDDSGSDGGDDPRLPLASVDDAAMQVVTPLAAVDPTQVTPARWGLDDRLLVLFTSGTTGTPKPVTLTAGNVLASALGSALRLGHVPGDRWLCELPAYHMGGVAPFYRTAIYGTTAVVVERERLTGRTGDDHGESGQDPTGRAGFDARWTLRALHDHDATGVSLVPTQLRRLLDAAEGATGPDALPGSLRFVLLGGGPAPDALVERCDRRDVPVCPTYGLTETASQVTTARPETATDEVGTVGPPLALTDVVVAQPVEEGEDAPAEDRAPPGFRECPEGEAGEVLVRGPTVTPGYYRAPGRTAEAFAGEWLRTGDRGHLSGGRLYVEGRRDDRIVTGGENVDPAAVERALRAVEGVRAATVVGVPDPEWGERVAALVVPEDHTGDATDEENAGTAPTREKLLGACRERLPGHAVPRTLRFVDAVPRTTSGTVDRDAARDRLDRTTGEDETGGTD